MGLCGGGICTVSDASVRANGCARRCTSVRRYPCRQPGTSGDTGAKLNTLRGIDIRAVCTDRPSRNCSAYESSTSGSGGTKRLNHRRSAAGHSPSSVKSAESGLGVSGRHRGLPHLQKDCGRHRGHDNERSNTVKAVATDEAALAALTTEEAIAVLTGAVLERAVADGGSVVLAVVAFTMEGVAGEVDGATAAIVAAMGKMVGIDGKWSKLRAVANGGATLLAEATGTMEGFAGVGNAVEGVLVAVTGATVRIVGEKLSATIAVDTAGGTRGRALTLIVRTSETGADVAGKAEIEDTGGVIADVGTVLGVIMGDILETGELVKGEVLIDGELDGLLLTSVVVTAEESVDVISGALMVLVETRGRSGGHGPEGRATRLTGLFLF
ncbi:hypothetical protein HDU96_009172 [Phlyctochytrium bullatum]|nr:hypothetical protein HDU96_009172 [Phlyctochytrium bullatum]